MAYFKIAFFSGLVVAMPAILYQAWAFLSPAIGERARRYSATFVMVSLLSFILGGLFAYFILLPSALNFLLSIGKEDLIPMISVEKYVSFVLTIILCAGLVFEMPVAIFILTRMGIANHRFLRKKFKYAILAIFIIAAVITPTPDVFNMTLLAIPMIFLYEISIWVSFFATSRSGVRHPSSFGV